MREPAVVDALSDALDEWEYTNSSSDRGPVDEWKSDVWAATAEGSVHFECKGVSKTGRKLRTAFAQACTYLVNMDNEYAYVVAPEQCIDDRHKELYNEYDIGLIALDEEGFRVLSTGGQDRLERLLECSIRAMDEPQPEDIADAAFADDDGFHVKWPYEHTEPNTAWRASNLKEQAEDKEIALHIKPGRIAEKHQVEDPETMFSAFELIYKRYDDICDLTVTRAKIFRNSGIGLSGRTGDGYEHYALLQTLREEQPARTGELADVTGLDESKVTYMLESWENEITRTGDEHQKWMMSRWMEDFLEAQHLAEIHATWSRVGYGEAAREPVEEPPDSAANREVLAALAELQPATTTEIAEASNTSVPSVHDAFVYWRGVSRSKSNNDYWVLEAWLAEAMGFD